MPKINVNNSSVQLSTWDNRTGSLVLNAWDDQNNFILHRRWRIEGTAQLIHAYWLVRRWLRVSRRTRTTPAYRHNWLKWNQFGPPLVNQYEQTPAVIARAGTRKK